jgi:hypothetical protein
MGHQTAPSLYRAKRLRATVLDINGRPLVGNESVVITKGVISVAFKADVTAGQAITLVNGNGDNCVNEPAAPSFNGFTVDATFCNVDFSLFHILTGHRLILNDNGTVVGIAEGTTVDLSTVNFALELWTGASTTVLPRTGGDGVWGYILAPFLRGGTIGDISVANGTVTFNVTGMATKNGAAWAQGPFLVDLVGGVAALLHDSVTVKEHRRIQAVEIQPPLDYEGAIPLLDPVAPALTSVTETATLLSVAFSPVPAGTDTVFYDLGDGTWDSAETGSYTHVYAAAGTYQVIAKRGLSTITTSVTVTA